MSPDNRHHRGPHPADKSLFSAMQIKKIKVAFSEYCWLLNHGYSGNASLALIGNHHGLNKRQRLAIARAACTDEQKKIRQRKQILPEKTTGKEVIIDGFNIVISIEAVLSGALILRCRDGCLRDLSGVHGSYRPVDETNRAIQLIGLALDKMKPESVLWILDKPVSNSGRLAAKIKDLAAKNNWSWSVELQNNPDKLIADSPRLAITSDSTILDKTDGWININSFIINHYFLNAWLVNFGD